VLTHMTILKALAPRSFTKKEGRSESRLLSVAVLTVEYHSDV
jgi:hypothetical protein